MLINISLFPLCFKTVLIWISQKKIQKISLQSFLLFAKHVINNSEYSKKKLHILLIR